MNARPIIVTSLDMERLKNLIAQMRQSDDLEQNVQEAITDLEKELSRAKVVQPQEVPADVVTMNSMVRVRSLQGKRRAATWTVVYPDDADFDNGHISVLEPLGTALLGYHKGDEFEWEMPAGLCRYLIEDILSQPEAAGEYDR